MNEKAIFEIAEHIRAVYTSTWPKFFPLFGTRRMPPKEITQCYEYKMFKEECPELCRLAEE